MLLGQWGEAKFATDVCTLFNGTADAFDHTKGKSRKDQRDDKTKADDLDRDYTPLRGLSSYHEEEIKLKQKEASQRDIELQLKREMVDEEKRNFSLVVRKETILALEKKLTMNLNMMTKLEAEGKQDWVDSKGVNRYEQAL